MSDVFRNSKRAVLRFFEDRRPRAYRMSDLRAVLRELASEVSLASVPRASDLVELLTDEGLLREVRLRPEVKDYKDMTRYLVGECTALEIASTLRTSGYLSHGTAVFMHGLTEQVPRTWYVNAEQTPKPEPAGALTQEGLDRAFSRKQRSSRYAFLAEGNRFIILSGKHTDRYGVIEMTGPSGERQQVTNLERTLVDIVVRPGYSGGLFEVLEAYTAAMEQVSVGRILATLKKLGHKYPYHQAIGFLLERAGASGKKLDRLRSLGLEHDFYLAHAMANPVLDESWRIFYPEGF